MNNKTLVLLLFGLIFAPLITQAQEDSLSLRDEYIRPDTNILIHDSDTISAAIRKTKKNPKLASWLSAGIPGAGQVYNEKYWKVPIVYSALGGSLYLINHNHRQYKRFLKAYQADNDDDETTVSEFEGTRSADNVAHYKDQFRRNRDLAVISFAAIYVLNILDASVDAHLSDYDISDDLSFYTVPKVIYAEYKSYYGIAFGIYIR